ncbi:MAG: hypothetical protein COV74_03175 [Candidatus Omnitrophica bacterium CG11_big_fil_rev_8_21_14_0_20_45_26]|uniref:Phytanoyl-CoA dioxygenase n=1 Tax=Candidatus Abzuiibacterium crystallinum TaxID=1974748 RepID=A0A2H0LR57_9BACT|nr:MAG: hypothetical protein COV74_03175 [Candidatus Omnitrophica bacterium CG11_big_fil_rev_8_21_14_0_20_45_26]PIW64677.1 MAG: hypothetical protein COW12_05200 [Candidatus Omnitrophica bacterium CG12_big_fil_rev_8_21_14_0_65_45_16]
MSIPAQYHAFAQGIIRFPALRPISYFVWSHGFNSQRVQSYARASKRPALSLVSQELRKEGIVGTHVNHFFSSHSKHLLEQIENELEQKRSVASFQKNAYQTKGEKAYREMFLSKMLSFEHPAIQLALQPELLQMVGDYLGMWGFLRAIDIWHDFPTQQAEAETQYWHRDYIDVMNVKVFIYLNDVTKENGPFCYVPKTHARGSIAKQAQAEKDGRIRDEKMIAVAPESQWRICAGEKHSIVIADTSGYHKGLKPTKSDRYLLMFLYTSGHPWYPRDFQWQKEVALDRLPNDQVRFAVLQGNNQ